MKPYGVPRTDDAENCDVADALKYGRKTSVHPHKSGPKKWARRFWKKFARREAKAQTNLELE